MIPKSGYRFRKRSCSTIGWSGMTIREKSSRSSTWSMLAESVPATTRYSCRIARTRGTPRCAAQNVARPARCGSDPLRPRIASTLHPASPEVCSAASEPHCPSAAPAPNAVRSTMAALGARVSAKLQRGVAWVRRHERDDHRPRTHGAKRGRHRRQPLFRRHVMPFRWNVSV